MRKTKIKLLSALLSSCMIGSCMAGFGVSAGAMLYNSGEVSRSALKEGDLLENGAKITDLGEWGLQIGGEKQEQSSSYSVSSLDEGYGLYVDTIDEDDKIISLNEGLVVNKKIAIGETYLIGDVIELKSDVYITNAPEKVNIASNGRYQIGYPRQTGSKYYFESLFKEAGGTDTLFLLLPFDDSMSDRKVAGIRCTGGDGTTSDKAYTFELVFEDPGYVSDSTYTITIPSKLNVSKAGWNKIGDISVTGTLKEGETLEVTPSSETDFNLVNENDETQKIAYTVNNADGEKAGAKAEKWDFGELSTTAVKKTIGIVVDDYSEMPSGNYNDTVIFTASIIPPEVSFEIDLPEANGKWNIECKGGDKWSSLADDLTSDRYTINSYGISYLSDSRNLYYLYVGDEKVLTVNSIDKTKTYKWTAVPKPKVKIPNPDTTSQITPLTFNYEDGQTWSDAYNLNKLSYTPFNISVTQNDGVIYTPEEGSKKALFVGDTRVKSSDPIDGDKTYTWKEFITLTIPQPNPTSNPDPITITYVDGQKWDDFKSYLSTNYGIYTYGDYITTNDYKDLCRGGSPILWSDAISSNGDYKWI